MSTSFAWQRVEGLVFGFLVVMAIPSAVLPIGVLDSRIALVEADLIAEVDSVAAGQPFHIAVRLTMKDTWHVNWRNPGDAGLAPGIEWQLPDGFSAGIIQWPHPTRYHVGPLAIFGYDDEVLLISEITPPASLPPGTVITLGASTSWLACQESCVAGDAELQIQIPVGHSSRTSGANSESFNEARRSLPTYAPGWRFTARIENEDFIVVDLNFSGLEEAPLQSVFFFPELPGIIENAAAQSLTAISIGAGYQLRIERNRMEARAPEQLTGIIVSETGWGQEAGTKALQIDIPLGRR